MTCHDWERHNIYCVNLRLHTLFQMAQQLNPELKDAYMKSPDDIMAEARRGNMASFVNATTNLLVACSIHMRDSRAVQPPSAPTHAGVVTPTSNKRKAEELVAEASEPEDPLSAALKFSFNTDSVECM